MMKLDQIKHVDHIVEALSTRNTQLKKEVDMFEVDMFEKFKEIDETQGFEILDNGYVLRVSGRDHDDGWLQQSFVFHTLQDMFVAIEALVELR